MTRQRESDGGFTIVEVVVSLVLLSLTALSIISIAVSAQYAQRDAYYMSEASRAAQSKIQEIQAMSFDDVAEGTTSFSSDSRLNKLPAGKTGTVVISTPALAPNSKQIDVTVTYNVGTYAKKVEMTAYADPAFES